MRSFFSHSQHTLHTGKLNATEDEVTAASRANLHNMLMTLATY